MDIWLSNGFVVIYDGSRIYYAVRGDQTGPEKASEKA